MSRYKKYMKYIGKPMSSKIPNHLGLDTEYYDFKTGCSGFIFTTINVVGFEEPHAYMVCKNKIFHSYISVYDPYYPAKYISREFIIEEYKTGRNFVCISVKEHGVEYFSRILDDYSGEWILWANEINKSNAYNKKRKKLKSNFDKFHTFMVTVDQDGDSFYVVQTNDKDLADAVFVLVKIKYDSANLTTSTPTIHEPKKRYELWNNYSSLFENNFEYYKYIRNLMISRGLSWEHGFR